MARSALKPAPNLTKHQQSRATSHIWSIQRKFSEAENTFWNAPHADHMIVPATVTILAQDAYLIDLALGFLAETLAGNAAAARSSLIDAFEALKRRDFDAVPWEVLDTASTSVLP